MPDISILVKAKDEASNVLKGIGGSAEGLGGAFSSLGIVGPASLVAVGVGLTKLAMDAANIEEVRNSFDNLAIDAGKDADQFLADLTRMSGGQVSQADLMMMTNKALIVSGTDVADRLPTYFAIARAASEATGESFEEMFQKLTMGIESGSTRMLRQLGLTIDVDQAQQKYAASIGKSVDALDDQEKKLAAENAVMEAADGMLERLGTTTVTTDDKMEQFSAHVADLKLALGTLLIPALGTGVDILIAFLDSIMNADKKAQDLTTTLFESSGSAEEFALKVAGMQEKASGADWTLEQLTRSEAYLAAMTLYATMATEKETKGLADANEIRTDATHRIEDQTDAIIALTEETAKATLAMQISSAGQILDIRDAVEAYDELKNKVISAYADTSETTYNYQQEMTRTEEDALADREELLVKQAEKRAWVASGDWERSQAEQDEAHGYWEGILNQELADFDAGVTEKATRREEDYNHEIEVANRAAGQRAAIAEAERQAELEQMREAQAERVTLYALEIMEFKGLLTVHIEGYGDMKVSAQEYYDLVSAGVIPVTGDMKTAFIGSLDEIDSRWDDSTTNRIADDEFFKTAVTGHWTDIFNLGDKTAAGIATSFGTYIVQAGDTLGTLATKWGTTVGEIVAKNEEILNPNFISIGQIINKPFDEASTKVGTLKGDLEDLGLTGETEAGDVSSAMDLQFSQSVRIAQTDTGTLKDKLGEMGITGEEAAEDIQIEIQLVITTLGGLEKAIIEKMPRIEKSIREGMEDPVGDALDELEDFRRDFEALDGKKVHTYIYIHEITVPGGAIP